MHRKSPANELAWPARSLYGTSTRERGTSTPSSTDVGGKLFFVANDALPPARVGIQAGPVVFQEGDYFGRTVNVAARIAEYTTRR